MNTRKETTWQLMNNPGLQSGVHRLNSIMGFSPDHADDWQCGTYRRETSGLKPGDMFIGDTPD
jgi:hypothetical protein